MSGRHGRETAIRPFKKSELVGELTPLRRQSRAVAHSMREVTDGQGIMGLGRKIVIPTFNKEGPLAGNTLVVGSLASLVQALLGPLPLTKGRAQPGGMLRGPVTSNGRRGEKQAKERLLNNRMPVGGLRKERRASLNVR